MPYYVYRIADMPLRRLDKLEQHDAFKAASQRAKQLRGELPPEAGCTIKVIFAENELHAEDLLNQVRSASPDPDD